MFVLLKIQDFLEFLLSKSKKFSENMGISHRNAVHFYSEFRTKFAMTDLIENMTQYKEYKALVI